MDAKEIRPGLICGTGVEYSGGVGPSKKAFPGKQDITGENSDFCKG